MYCTSKKIWNFLFISSYKKETEKGGARLEVQTKAAAEINIHTKENMTIKKALQIYGIFAVIGMFLSNLTIPVSLNEEMQFFLNEELKLSPTELKEFSVFIIVNACVFFGVIHTVFRKRS